MTYYGDIALGQELNFDFTSRDSTGTPSTLSGVRLAVSRDNSTSSFSGGMSLTTDLGGIQGRNHIRLTTASSTTQYLEGHDYSIFALAGQVSVITILGEVVGQFSVSNRFGGAALYGLLAANGTTSQLSLPSGATTTNDIYNGHLVYGATGPGMGQARLISDYTGSGANAQLDSALGTAFTSATTVALYPVAPAVAGSVNSIIPGSYSGVTISGILSMASADVHQLIGSAAHLTRLQSHVSSIVTGQAVAGTLSTTVMTTDVQEATNDHFNGRVLVFTSGALLGQATSINTSGGYVGLSATSSRFAFAALTEAPTAGLTFVIV